MPFLSIFAKNALKSLTSADFASAKFYTGFSVKKQLKSEPMRFIVKGTDVLFCGIEQTIAEHL